jgi:2-oxoglutarate ferredoxin oxidoreductase subunit alpha
MADFGSGYRFHVTGLAHDSTGFPTNDIAEISRCNWRILEKINVARSEFTWVDKTSVDDAEILIFAYGSVGRTSLDAVKMLREKGVKAGLFRPVTIWPFPSDEVEAVFSNAGKVLVPELNAGQLAGELRKYVPRSCRMDTINRLDGEIITPDQIIEAVEKLNAA